MMSVHRVTEIREHLKSLSISPDEISEMIENGDLEVDIQSLAIEAIDDLDHDFIDIVIESNPERFSMSAMIELHGIDGILDKCIEEGDYEDVLEHVENHAKVSDEGITELALERTKEGWKLHHYGIDHEILSFTAEKEVKDLMRDLYKGCNGFYATLETLGYGYYSYSQRHTVYLLTSYAETIFNLI